MLTLTKNQKIKLQVLVLIGCILFGITRLVLADSYVLTASVPYAVPTVASSIDPIGTTTSTTPTVITGTCGFISPAAIVSLWNGASLLGATTCQFNSTFSLVVSLQLGTNSMIAKTSNIANVYGPEGPGLIFTYYPTKAPPTPSSSPPLSDLVTTPAVTAPTLQVSSPQPFGILSNSGQVSVDVTVQGGDTPYAINIKWGDGKSDNQTVTESGTYTFTHVYKQKNNYTAAIKVVDNKGNTSNIFIPFSDVKGAITRRDIPESDLPIIESHKITLSLIVLLFIVTAIAVSTFMLGKLHQKRIHRRATARKQSKKPSRK